ncbi:hypothetical protein T492DRAFT_1049000 [Pavlovales sp. CCMP2436]|nr:hypothetical protein T492DRAFT_1049000 [Pavlovales sp. CCMP2436]|mmetsp:Transcript_22183/g.56222  ORF Transcript_22183/g.56222 Transcript_22183/m.56222 type:complete len:331 (-) Transcript_22183:420-1412(-)|eukprot:CAMPEP_0179897406 /NCGR_PEP_ID=MMETSP0982-20121206/36996_1 /TAXON_ID=483367 /ORGANISM="non described non described, Strain CCMP 2436" /LENGTH=330 /DNA_ID=CAMNT_0021794449 /DNA_START=18 /DNA_END=1010 /DNA_ORIENTATION=+
MQALYVRPCSAGAEKRNASAHLERMLWSYVPDLVLDWTVSYGLPVVVDPPSAPQFEVAFVDEDALPPRFAPGDRSSAMLGAKRLVVVRRSHDTAPGGLNSAMLGLDTDHRTSSSPWTEGAGITSRVEVSRPLPYEAFCSLCAQLLAPELCVASDAAEYHPQSVLLDIWGEDAAEPQPMFVAPTAAACAKRTREDAFSTTSDASTSFFAEPCTEDSPTTPPLPTGPLSTDELNEAWGRLVNRVTTNFNFDVGATPTTVMAQFTSTLATSVLADCASLATQLQQPASRTTGDQECSQQGVIGRLDDEPSPSCGQSWTSSDNYTSYLASTRMC